VTALHTLIRLHRRQLDERRRDLVALQTRELALQDQLVQLDDDFAAETAAVRAAPDLGLTMAAFTKAFQRRRAQTQATLTAIHRQIAQQEEAIAEAFQELKRLEIAEELRTTEAIAAAKRRDTLILDEQAATRFQRGAGNGTVGDPGV